MSSTVRINYVSGHSVTMEVEDFNIEWGKDGRKADWTLAPETATMRPLMINLDAIESVWEVLTPTPAA